MSEPYCDYLMGQLQIVSKGNRNALAASAICWRLAQAYRGDQRNADSVTRLEQMADVFNNLYSPRAEYDRRPWWRRVFANGLTETTEILRRDAQEAADIINGKGLTE